MLFFCLAFACKDDNAKETEIAKLNIDITIERFDVLYANATAKDLPELKRAYPFMFSKKVTDSFWIAKMRDTLELELAHEVSKTFTNTDILEGEIENLYNHIAYYFPEFTPLRIITTTSMVDYRNSVIVTDTIALLALDNYLGENHHFYVGIQEFLRKNFKPSQIVVDLAKKHAMRYIHQPYRKTLLDEMIYHGKILYFLDMVLPNTLEAQRISYTNSELSWAKVNEAYIWRYFIERELLYSTDTKLPNRFINPAPFSKFYLEEIDTDSPGRLGQFIGWQIVKSFMNANDTTLRDMLKMNPETIFNDSRYKPKK